MAAIEDALLMKSKFRGCILGGLLGDCCGEPFEFGRVLSCDQATVQKFFDDLDAADNKGAKKRYTDDTVMTLNIIECLIESPPVNYNRMAQLFAEGFFNEPPVRNYGGNVRHVFRQLRNRNYQNIYTPAAQQFNGTGSYGNGGAMRIAPVGLFYHNDYEAMIDVVNKTTMITHTHKLGVNGAILQCLAVQQALLLDSTCPLDVCKFVEDLIVQMESFEISYDVYDAPPPYQTKLKSVIKFATTETVPSKREIVKVLGNDLSAFGAVPTAIYCFLRAQNEIPGVESDNVFRRTIQYVMTLGGDTDTIGTMAGAIAGAYYGEGILSENMLGRCEKYEKIKEMADKLFLSSFKK